MDDARVRPDEVLPRRRRLDLVALDIEPVNDRHSADQAPPGLPMLLVVDVVILVLGLPAKGLPRRRAAPARWTGSAAVAPAAKDGSGGGSGATDGLGGVSHGEGRIRQRRVWRVAPAAGGTTREEEEWAKGRGHAGGARGHGGEIGRAHV